MFISQTSCKKQVSYCICTPSYWNLLGPNRKQSMNPSSSGGLVCIYICCSMPLRAVRQPYRRMLQPQYHEAEHSTVVPSEFNPYILQQLQDQIQMANGYTIVPVGATSSIRYRVGGNSRQWSCCDICNPRLCCIGCLMRCLCPCLPQDRGT